MKKMLIYPFIATLLPFVSFAAPKCNSVFSQSIAQQNWNAPSAHPKVLKVLDLIEAKDFTGAHKVAANIRLSLHQHLRNIPQDSSLISQLTSHEQQLLIENLESAYGEIPLKLHVLAMELYQLGQFELTDKNIDNWVNAYIAKLNSSANQSHATHLVTPLRSLDLMNRTIPEKLLKAVEARVIETHETLQYSLTNIRQLLRVFAWTGAEPHSFFMSVMDAKLVDALEAAYGEYLLSGTLKESLIIGSIRSFEFLKSEPSDALLAQWAQLKEAVEKKVATLNDNRMDAEFALANKFINKTNNRMYDRHHVEEEASFYDFDKTADSDFGNW